MPRSRFRWLNWFAATSRPSPAESEPPLRAELFGLEQLSRHAKTLAAAHEVIAQAQSNQLLDRLDANEEILRNFNIASRAVSARRRITPAAEWLLDNFYLIEEQIQMARRHLPKGYSRELPCLARGPSMGFPRVYDIVLELISHVDAQVDGRGLSAFLEAYQSGAVLKLGELWAVPIMLRLGLIENLQRVTARLSVARRDSNLADTWVDRLQAMAETNPAHLVVVVADMAKSELPLSSSFVAEFCQRLSRQSPVLHLARTWLEQRLGEQGLTIEQLIQVESQRQAADQVSVSHSISSLRLLSALDWKEFVETLSRVDRTLRADPAAVYGRMDFSTRDRYRHAVETLARHSSRSETEIAEKALAFAEAGAVRCGRDDRSAHVGYYLIDEGQAELERDVRVQWPWRHSIERSIQRRPFVFYGGGVTLLTAIMTVAFGAYADVLPFPAAIVLAGALVVLLCTSQLAVSLMNSLSMALAKPRLLPRLDFSSGIPGDCQTLVAVPAMLTHPGAIDRLLETVELHYLSNRDPHLFFALLTDFTDADVESQPGDEALLARAKSGIALLNRKYSDLPTGAFYLFHRPRRWNGGERRWIGYERKRGKLSELNAVLRGECRDCFSSIIGDMERLPSIRYVITLDSDTRIPRDAARQLVGTMAHRLNLPVFDAVRGVVVSGYGILQPRVAISLPSARRSWFVRIFAGDAGIDPYTREVSDAYQDIFHEGSFVGKGIYDVDAFRRALDGRFPDNTVLSHDLLEACHARSGLVSDVELYEEFPSRHNVDTARRHRWIRGDWQVAPWLWSRVPTARSPQASNPLSPLSQWKIFDNLRRSLVPVALFLAIPAGWLLAPALGAAGVLLVLAVVGVPALLASSSSLVRRPVHLPWSLHFRTIRRTGYRQVAQILLTIAFLPYDAWVSLDAIVRTLTRMRLTRRNLLEWQTSSEAAQTLRVDLLGSFRTLWIAPVSAILGALLLVVLEPDHLAPALPLIGLWLAAPWLSWRISQPFSRSAPDLTLAQTTFLRHTARRTWHFFERFVTAEENWLPPDNFQEIPVPTVAHRTSPTNLGLALLANLSAWDLGYLSGGGLIRRTRVALAAMQRLERHRGHFYNWYDTLTLQPLQPDYVSSVDSGNLAGHLLTLGAGLREQANEAIFSPRLFRGIEDTIGIVESLDPENAFLARLATVAGPAPASLREAGQRLDQLAAHASAYAEAAENLSEDLKVWAETLQKTCEDHRDDLAWLVPWHSLGQPPSAGAGGGDSATARLTAALVHCEARPTLQTIASMFDEVQPLVHAALLEAALRPADEQREANAWLAGVSRCLKLASSRAEARIRELATLAREADGMAVMDFTFLFNREKALFSTGFNVAEHRCDASSYDLLASEARLCSYVAIALGQIPQDHWFSLGRLLVASHGDPILVSWSGSMFEYLMPLLVMPHHEKTLLAHTCKAVVQQQIEYGELRGVPWGISESGYNQTDVHLNYQYRAFGVPGLGLKRGLADALVVAPYASAMALMVSPAAACQNLERLAAEGRSGNFGFYEAVDYTPGHLPPGTTSTTVRSYMVHHHGMSLVALGNLLSTNSMHHRFMACPLLKAADLLLEERVPKTAATVFTEDLTLEGSLTLSSDSESVMRVFNHPHSSTPEAHLLSNGRYHVAISSAGGGYSRWQGLAVTRWHEDSTRDNAGLFVYLREVATDQVWSVSHQPTRRKTESYEAIFTQSRAEFRQRHQSIDTHTEISVSPEDDVELRRITLTNRSGRVRTIELTSYAEVVLAAPAADAAHPAFSNLFVQTELTGPGSALLCTRRARSPEEQPPWLLHLMAGEGGLEGETSCETDRSRFIGRGGDLASPAALRTPGPLSNTTGSVLDPIIALRRNVTLEANGTVVITLITGATATRSAALALVEKFQNVRMVDRAFDLAWTHSQVILRHLSSTEGEAQWYGRLASALIYANPARRPHSGILCANRRGQSGLWSYGISGDAPIVLLRISDPANIELARQLIQAHSYWRMKGLSVELVILNEEVSVYRQSLQEQVTQLVASGIEAQMLDKPGGIFVRRRDQVSNEDLGLLQATARIVLDDDSGTLAEQLERRSGREASVPALITTRQERAGATAPLPPRDLIFDNGLGGFTRDGREYVIVLEPGEMTPAPWVNVIANPHFGTVVSESGSAYTWTENAHEFRLTPWSNDPVRDPSGEALYLRDEQSGEFWSPTPLPARGTTPYVIRHGFGYTVFEHTEHGIESEVWVYVAHDAAVKFSVVKVRNVSGRARRLSVTGYWEWVLGDLRAKSVLHVQTEVDLKTGALLARNPYNTEFPDRLVFVDVNEPERTLTGDRKEFIGRNRSLREPAALGRARLSGKVGAGLDPCGALQVTFDLAETQEREVSFRLGVGRDPAEVHGLIHRFRGSEAGGNALTAVQNSWRKTLGAVEVETPDPAVNVMANGWLLYQTISCRLWGRTGFYQSGGAYGFRDQLQDVMALVHAEPGLAREHLLRAAARQFSEGDVQHWWHPPAGRGVRTHFSDDFLWLPFVLCRYVSTVGDRGVLEERLPFLEGRSVKAGEEAYYDLPNRSEATATLYEHALRAVTRGLRFGEHGLPLIGCGDWNDGMNRVGNEGRGESVWLAFFLYDVLLQFETLARSHGDPAFADRCATEARQLQLNIEAHAWDGEWYRRAYFDNGEPLGSHLNPECQIDSLPQSWSVLSGAGDPARARQAMNAVERRLVRRADGLVQLFDPPFDKSSLDPGYIKGYIPGVRENGGQYTHGAIWTAMAFARLGDGDRAWGLFNLLNPVNHGSSPAQIATYRVEPYVVAADVYGVPPHTGRGGWTWYTGSAGWMYRLLIESLLGIELEGDSLRIVPHLPAGWNTFGVRYRHGESLYRITITRLPADDRGKPRLLLNGEELPEGRIPLGTPPAEHSVQLWIA